MFKVIYKSSVKKGSFIENQQKRKKRIEKMNFPI